jgi:hypothetical protein
MAPVWNGINKFNQELASTDAGLTFKLRKF